MENLKAWNQIDTGLKNLMDKNDELSDGELMAKSKRLKHLAVFAETLRLRVNERIKGVKVGPIEPLFDAFLKARAEVDKNN
jgi:hypothetical protein